MSLQPKLGALLGKKIHNSMRVRPDDSNVVVSVNERSERDLIKRFDEVQVDWSVVDKQLLSWGELLRAGKRLRVDISFNHVETQAALPAYGGAWGVHQELRAAIALAKRLAPMSENFSAVAKPGTRDRKASDWLV
jgi:hypothetical protein